MQTMNTVKAALTRELNHGRTKNGTVEIQGVSFKAHLPTMFGGLNDKYIQAELAWYESQSTSVTDLAYIYNKRVKIWDDVSGEDDDINSNYGYLIYSDDNHNQYDRVLNELGNNPSSRRAVMVYTNPNIHDQATENGKNDFICTNTVQYFLNRSTLTEGRPWFLDCVVQMRSNDAVFGYNNDRAWQQHVLRKLSQDLLFEYDIDTNPQESMVTWQVGSFHLYERHWGLLS